jgi:hypothetical protein
MKKLNACVVLVSSCWALPFVLGASVCLGSSVEHPFDELYEGAHEHPKHSFGLNRAA